jgi:5-methylcytosine-specific restriction endonuclease McrA
MFRLLLDQYDWLAHQNREVTQAEREEHAAMSRRYYARHRQQEVSRHVAWKAAHPERNNEYSRTRQERIQATDDGTATLAAIARLKREATHCAYCGSRLLRKQTDHMTPVCLGGQHSLCNIVIVCPDCNGKKHTLSYAQWIERVEPRYRARVASLWAARFGELAVGAPGLAVLAGVPVEGIWRSMPDA